MRDRRNGLSVQIDQQVEAYRQSLADDFLTKMRALSDLSANSNGVWWISAFVVFLLVGIEITPVLVKVLSPVGPYDIKLDAMNNVESNEALLKRDTTNRILQHHYAHVETAELQADDNLIDIRTKLAKEALQKKASLWGSRAGGPSATVQQFVDDVRTDIFTQRSAG